MKRIPVAGPWITQREIDYVADAAAHAWYADAARWHVRFEGAMAEHTGRKLAMALPSCTSALHLVLAALGVGPGDEVIIADVTWIATAAPIRYVGATAVFADMDPVTWCISPESVEACLTSRTRAVLAVNLYGNMPDMDGLARICSRAGVPLVEDAAESAGSTYRGRPAGSFGLASTFSFHGSKTVTTGEGGMLLTDDEGLFRRAQFLRDHGRPPGDRMFFNTEVAFKYKMSSLQAAMGTAQIERIGEIVERKRTLFGWYRQRLGGRPGITLNPEPDGGRNSYWMVTAILDPKLGLPKKDLMEALSAKGIDTRPFFHPLSSLPAYQGDPQADAARRRNAVAYALTPWGLNLPSALSLTEDDVEFVCRSLDEALTRSAAR